GPPPRARPHSERAERPCPIPIVGTPRTPRQQHPIVGGPPPGPLARRARAPDEPPRCRGDHSPDRVRGEVVSGASSRHPTSADPCGPPAEAKPAVERAPRTAERAGAMFSHLGPTRTREGG